jgi:hypothetical protein
VPVAGAVDASGVLVTAAQLGLVGGAALAAVTALALPRDAHLT